MKGSWFEIVREIVRTAIIQRTDVNGKWPSRGKIVKRKYENRLGTLGIPQRWSEYIASLARESDDISTSDDNGLNASDFVQICRTKKPLESYSNPDGCLCIVSKHPDYY